MAGFLPDALMVAAINLGTTFCGYAFAIQDELEKDSSKIYFPYWHASDGSFISHKTPTTVLLDKEEKLISVLKPKPLTQNWQKMENTRTTSTSVD